jgi:complex iron-sulfur molybdoenzyme family reductase subunit beta
VALGLREDYGTAPNVYYVPPVSSPVKYDAHGKIIKGSNRLPIEELEKLFGQEVHHAIKVIKSEMKKRKETGESELMDILIAHKHEEMFRLDNEYYHTVAKENNQRILSPLDKRYLSGKYTDNVLDIKFTADKNSSRGNI